MLVSNQQQLEKLAHCNKKLYLDEERIIHQQQSKQ
jgi:hypothetical protein